MEENLLKVFMIQKTNLKNWSRDTLTSLTSLTDTWQSVIQHGNTENRKLIRTNTHLPNRHC